MANTKSAKKRIRQAEAAQARNRSYRTRMRGAIKALRAQAEAGEAEAALAALPNTLSLIDATAQKGVIHANTASRYKSRLTKMVSSVGAAE